MIATRKEAARAVKGVKSALSSYQAPSIFCALRATLLYAAPFLLVYFSSLSTIVLS